MIFYGIIKTENLKKGVYSMRKVFISSLVFIFIFGMVGSLYAADKKPWTVMVFLNADNNLERAGLKDINEMEMIGSNDAVNVVVQIDRCSGYDSSNGDWTGTRRYYITKDNDKFKINSKLLKDLGEVNMGNPEALYDFVKFSIKNYPADHYALIIWNHGAGWKKRNKDQITVIKGVSYDDTDRDHLTMLEVKNVIESIKNKLLGKKIDVLDYDACLMGMIEVAYQIKDNVKYLVASEQTEPGDGDDYIEMLKGLKASTTPKEFAIHIAKTFIDFYSDGWSSVTKSAVNLSKVQYIADNIDKAFSLIKANISKFQPVIKNALGDVQKFYDRDYVDLYDLVKKIKDNINDFKIELALNDILKSVKGAVIYNGKYGYSMKKANGIAIYFPRTESKYLKRYDNISFSKDTVWNEFLKSYYNPVSSNTNNDSIVVNDNINISNGSNTNIGNNNSNWLSWFKELIIIIQNIVALFENDRISEVQYKSLLDERDMLVDEGINRINDAFNKKDFESIKEFLILYSKATPEQKKILKPILEELRMKLIISIRTRQISKDDFSKIMVH